MNDPRILHAAQRGASQAQQLPTELPEAVAQFNWNAGGFEWLTKYNYAKHHKKPLYTADQMHSFADAKVRAAMAQQSQDAKLEPLVREALRKAFSFGQRYWQQADSEYASDQKKSDETQLKFLALIEETIAAMQGDSQ